jgi:hypothetical protein
MDHLPQPEHPYRPLSFIHLQGESYDGQGFSGFLACKSWDMKSLTLTLYNPHDEWYLRNTRLVKAREFYESLLLRLPEEQQRAHKLAFEMGLATLKLAEKTLADRGAALNNREEPYPFGREFWKLGQPLSKLNCFR